jgi:hypothetical protein
MVERWGLVLLLVGASACGRNGFGFGSDPAATDSNSGSDSVNGTEPVVPNPTDPNRPDVGTLLPDVGIPPIDPPDGCGDGIVTPGELCFDDQVVYPARIDPCAIDIGDLDDDGHLDVAVPNSDFDHIDSPPNYASVLYGDGFGTLSPPNTTAAGSDIPVGIAVGDFNRDGFDDLVVANNDAGELTAMMGQGGRLFGAPTPQVVGGTPTVVTTADLDGNDLPDVGMTLGSAGVVSISRSNGSGGFLPPLLVPVAGSPWGIAFGDINGDGAIDMATTDVTSDLLSLRFGRGDGTFFNSEAALTVGFGALDVKIVDIDLDGDADIITADHDVGTLSVYRGQPDGSLLPDPPIVGLPGPRGIAVSDFDADGDLDLAIIHDVDQVVWFVLGDGVGGLTPTSEAIPVGTLPSGIRAGDFNEDGIDDIVVSNQLDNEVGVILSNP